MEKHMHQIWKQTQHKLDRKWLLNHSKEGMEIPIKGWDVFLKKFMEI